MSTTLRNLAFLALTLFGSSALPAIAGDDAVRIERTGDNDAVVALGVPLAEGSDLRATFDFGATKGLLGPSSNPSDQSGFVNADMTLVAVNHQPATKSSYVHLFLRSVDGDVTFLISNARVARLLREPWAKSAANSLRVESQLPAERFRYRASILPAVVIPMPSPSPSTRKGPSHWRGDGLQLPPIDLEKTAGAHMGGLGSGRPGSGAPMVECFRKIDLAALERLELVNAGDQKAIGSTLVELRSNGLLIFYFSPEHTQEFVPFLYTATQFGGRRRWLACPWCRRRCRVLYRAKRLRCRKCLELIYESTRQPWHQRVLDQADKLAFRVAGAAAAVYDPTTSQTSRSACAGRRTGGLRRGTAILLMRWPSASRRNSGWGPRIDLSACRLQSLAAMRRIRSRTRLPATATLRKRSMVNTSS